MSRSPAPALIAALALCLVLLLGGQALADALVPQASAAQTDQAVGHSGSSGGWAYSWILARPRPVTRP